MNIHTVGNSRCVPCDSELVEVDVTPSSLPFELKWPLKFVAPPPPTLPATPRPLFATGPTFVKSCVNALGESACNKNKEK